MGTAQLSEMVRRRILDKGAIPSSIGYMGFPAAACSSLNSVACHGIPDRKPLNKGDVLSLDITCKVDGFYGDTCYTYIAGDPLNDDDVRLVEATRKSMMAGIECIKPGASTRDIGTAIEVVAKE